MHLFYYIIIRPLALQYRGMIWTRGIRTYRIFWNKYRWKSILPVDFVVSVRREIQETDKNTSANSYIQTVTYLGMFITKVHNKPSLNEPSTWTR